MRSITQKFIDEGIVKGETRGRQAGIQENRITMAKKMLSKRKSIEEIIELTELTKEQINQLK